MSVETDESVHTSDAIAIIGMAGRFPGASSVPELWQNLLAGKTAITRFTGAAKGPGEPVHARGVVSGVDAFDYEFFGCNAREAQILDPQQRLFLECSWQAFEAAGHVPARCEGKVGVYASSYLSTYLLSHLLPNTELVKEVGMVAIHQANVVDQLAPRVSYKLGLEGPSIGVQTACSSSLVAVHLACQALLTGECDLALAGGVSVVVPEDEPYTRMPGGMTSPQGLCRTFDARADGTVFSNGVGVVLLKRLDEALRDRDPVVAIIRGSAVNNDGASKVGYTAPGVEGQVRVVEAALHMAQVSPGSVGFIEAHGTGTDLGDAIEVRALAQLFPAEPGAPCLLGSLKANLGHLDNAAGVTGLIKAALSVREGMVPGTAHFEAANPKLELERTRFVVTSHTSPWQGPLPRRAGVSAFGIGGTNAHVVLEQPPEQSTSERAHAPAYLCVL